MVVVTLIIIIIGSNNPRTHFSASKVKLEWHSLVFCSLGAVAGMIFGLEVRGPACF